MAGDGGEVVDGVDFVLHRGAGHAQKHVSDVGSGLGLEEE
jgi:hypothetical protein